MNPIIFSSQGRFLMNLAILFAQGRFFMQRVLSCLVSYRDSRFAPAWQNFARVDWRRSPRCFVLLSQKRNKTTENHARSLPPCPVRNQTTPPVSAIDFIRSKIDRFILDKDYYGFLIKDKL